MELVISEIELDIYNLIGINKCKNSLPYNTLICDRAAQAKKESGEFMVSSCMLSLELKTAIDIFLSDPFNLIVF